MKPGCKTTITALIIGGLLITAAGALAWKTFNGIQPLPHSLNFENSNIRKVQILDRDDIPLTVTYQNRP
jgi:penicillin-binding protein 1C